MQKTDEKNLVRFALILDCFMVGTPKRVFLLVLWVVSRKDADGVFQMYEKSFALVDLRASSRRTDQKVAGSILANVPSIVRNVAFSNGQCEIPSDTVCREKLL